MQRGNLIPLKDSGYIENQKYAGKVLSSLHREIYKLIKEKSPLTLLELEGFSDEYIKKNNCVPTFFNYKGFPSCICTSLNKELVHGRPRNLTLKDGDVLKVDIGTTYNGAIADCAMTYVYGKVQSKKIANLLISCQDALNKAISEIEVGKCIGLIGHTIYSSANGFGVIQDYGGHGIGYDKLHDAPFIANKARADEGEVIQPGMSIAIEPMFVLSNNINTKVLPDKWTVVTSDIGCHFEHSVTFDEDGNKIIITEHGINVRDMLS